MPYSYFFSFRVLCIRSVWLVLVTSFFMSLDGIVSGQAAESFPFLAESISDRVNVRSGQNKNFEKLCQLQKGDEVIVRENNFGWYRIQLPMDTFVYVSDKYIGRLDEVYGETLVDHVNIRAAATTDATIVGQLKKGDRVRVLARKQGWYTIEPPLGATGWVSQELIKFKSMDIAGYKSRKASVVVAQVPSQASNDRKTISVSGYLQSALFNMSSMSYKLVGENQTYSVQGFNPTLDDFFSFCTASKHCLVTVDGSLGSELESSSSHPKINVLKIQLVL